MDEDAGHSEAAQAAAGWYPDPWFRGQRRYWDGHTWTAHAFPEDPAPRTSAGAASDLQPGAVWPPPTTGVPGGGPPPPDWWAPAGDTKPDTGPGPADTSPPSGRPGFWPPRGRTLVAILIVLGFMVGIVGGALLPRHTTQAPVEVTVPPAPSPSAPGATPRPASSDPSASVLSGLVVHQADVGATETVAPISGGTQVSGGATLDLCNGTFPSESLRTARLQVAADDGGSVVLSTEAVLYSSPAGGAQALAELKSVAAGCPSQPVVSPVGEATVTTQFKSAPDGSWPPMAGVDRLAFDFVSTDDTGQTTHLTTVYLRRGRALLGVYFPQPDGPQPSVDGQTTIPGIVSIFASRLAALPASAVS